MEAAQYLDGLMYFRVFWKQPKLSVGQVVNLLPTVYSSQQVRKSHPDLLIDFYESKLRFV